MHKLKILVQFLLILLMAQGAFAQGNVNCIDCHTDLGDELANNVEKYVNNDIHYSKGISCKDCHGGDDNPAIEDQDEAMNPRKGFIGVPSPENIPALCGKCHANAEYMRGKNPNIRIDQVDRFWTSNHGKLLKGGSETAATCTSCHGKHEIQSAKTPSSTTYPKNIAATCGQCHSDTEYMGNSSELTHTQETDYRESVHAFNMYEKGDISAPTCNDCHGNHGAAPPGVEQVHNVCGTCHYQNNELYNASTHKEMFESMDEPGCVTCHGNHKIKVITEEALEFSDNGVCTACHDEDSAEGKVITDIRYEIESLKTESHAAEAIVEDAETKGMEVEEGGMKLLESHNSLIKARNLVHSLDLAKIKEQTEEGKKSAGEAVIIGENALKELLFRRQGLFISLVVIVIFIGLLFVKIKEIDKDIPMKDA